MGQLATVKARAASLTRQLGSANGTTLAGAATQIGVVAAGAGVGAYVDEMYSDQTAGQRPSLMLGLGLAALGVWGRQPLAIRAASGCLSVTAAEVGRQMAVKAKAAAGK